jgi:hypothetical protein
MNRRGKGALATLAFVLVAGCGSSGSSASPARDGGSDSGSDSGIAAETGPESGSEAGPGDSGQPGDGGNDSFATATPITVGALATSGTLGDPSTAKGYYSFTGTAGETIVATAIAQTGSNPFDPTYPNLVITLFDSSQTALAQDDDPWPRLTTDPTLYTVLPSNGTYYLVVDDCNAAFGTGCTAPGQITHHAYTVQVANVGGPAAIPEGATTGMAGAATVAYVKPNGSSVYGLSLLYGPFQTSTDQYYFSFTPPADANVPAGSRARANFWIIPSGASDGNGSTASPGTVFVLDSANVLGGPLSQLDDTNYGTGRTAGNGPAAMSLPVQLGHQYYFVIEHSSQPEGSNDFFFVNHVAGSLSSTAPQTATTGNNSAATAQQLNANANANGTTTFAVDGNMTMLSQAVWFDMPLPSGVTTIAGACVAARAGSGVLGLTYELFQSGGVPSFATQTESLTADQSIASTALPAGTTSVLLSVNASAQSATVSDTSYVCQFTVSP